MPTGDPQLEPIFEEIETPTHGRVKACENLYPKQLKAEMAATLAHNHPRIVITPESDPAVIQEQLKSLAGGEDRVVLFTVTTNEHMQIVPKKFGEGELRHTNASRGDDVIAAGEGKIHADGLMSVSNGISGHYRCDASQSIRIAEDTLTSNDLSARFRPPEGEEP